MPILDFQTIGIAVVVLVLLAEKLFAFLRYRRERDSEYEPRHKPEIWQRYAQRDHVDRALDKVSARLTDVADKGAESRKDIYESIRVVREDVAGLKAETDMIGKQVMLMDTKIDRLIERPH